MIISKLSQVLFERQLKISDVARETGITRPTLTSLCNNNSKGINLDTLDKLCKFLSVTPNEILQFYDFELDSIKINILNNDIFVKSVSPSFIGDFPVLLSFYACIPIPLKDTQPIKSIGYCTYLSEKPANRLTICGLIYSQEGEARRLSMIVVKPLIFETLSNIIYSKFNNVSNIQFFARYRDLERFEKDIDISILSQ